MNSLEIKTLRPSRAKVVSLHRQAKELESPTLSTPNKKMNREALVSWLFLIGSLMFLLDAVLENLKGISFSSLLHISASILFTIGSALFIPDSSDN